MSTSEGPVFVELWPDNVVFIAHSFDEETVSRLRHAVLNTSAARAIPAESRGDLALRLQEFPLFNGFQQQVEKDVMQALQELVLQ